VRNRRWQLDLVEIGEGEEIASEYDEDLLTYIDGLETELSEGQLELLNTFIVDLKDGLSIDNLSDAFDVMYNLAGETAESSLRNMVKRSHDAVAVNSPTFTALEGFKSDGTTSYIDTNYNPNTESIKYTQNDCSLGIYSRTDVKEGKIDYSAGAALYGYLRYTNDTILYRLNQTAVNSSFANANSQGFYIEVRTASDAQECYKNASSLGTSSVVSTTISNANMYLCCYNNAGAPSLYSNKQLSMFFMGRSLSQSDVTGITNAFEAYMDANSRGVIP